MYFRIYEVAGKENLVVESDCNDCAHLGAARLLDIPIADGWAENFDYGQIDRLGPGDEAHKVQCTCSERERALREEADGWVDEEAVGGYVN